MKQTLSLIFIFLNFFSYSQDSTSISINSISDKYQRLVNELNDIQILSINNSDSAMEGRKFLLTMQEFDHGKAGKIDSLIALKPQLFYVHMGADSFAYFYKPANKISKVSSCSSDSSCMNTFTIDFALRSVGDSSKLIVKYPAIGLNVELKGNSDYSLRSLNIRSETDHSIPLNEDIPILAFTPGTKQGMFTGYCILSEADEKDWYSAFGVEHYYIFYLKVY